LPSFTGGRHDGPHFVDEHEGRLLYGGVSLQSVEAFVNRKMLARLLWKQCIFRPHVLSIFPPHGRPNLPHFVVRDWPWLVTNYGNGTLHLQNTTTGHLLPLTTDHIVEYRQNLDGQPPFLILKSQLCITASSVFLEPIRNWGPEAAINIEMLLSH
jgi:hypothetical protein